MTEPTPEAQSGLLWTYLKGYHAVHHIAMGTEMGLFGKLQEAGEAGCSSADLASSAELHAPYVDVWCRTGHHYGLLEGGDDGRYRLAPFMDKLLVDAADPRHLAPYVMTTARFVGKDLEDYPNYFKSGGTYSFQDHGHDFTRHIGDTTAGFHNVVARRMIAGIPDMKDRLEAGALVLDVGCGVGGLMIKIAQAWPNTSCLGVDTDPHGIEQAQTNIAASDVSDRVAVEHIGGEGIGHEAEFDLATMFEVLHEIAAEVRPQVMQGVAKALKPGGALFILDETYPSNLDQLRDPAFDFAVQTQFNEMIWGNIVPTVEEQRELFQGAGLKEIAREPIGGLFTMLVAVKE
ncbi:MAG: class I SAM-dependent methyltransferase [Alphaproteobacteria bacterium]|nr:class I SAM-dependent methyltransferase [Alphaproteobacteria bacterium]MDP6814571.1 class I SAM-dependent methyltransferase [Alphaproteobacteria bacterium]